MLADPNNLLLLLSLSDRFGDQGIVGLGIVIGNPVLRSATVDSLLLSCRAIGRGAEQALWASLLTHITSMGYVTLHAEYLHTERNHQVNNLFESFGMVKENDSTETHSKYTLDLPVQFSPPSWIAIEDKA
jgi:predicted enzyme involved in methoxymalonyl-ACP biosynthesis